MGRPDMAYFKFTNKLVKGEPIQIYNMGDMYRDFTYVDDIVTELERDFGFKPSTSLEEGLAKFAAWYKGYYKR